MTSELLLDSPLQHYSSDFAGLRDILAHLINLSSHLGIHLAPGTDSVAIVRSSMKPYIGGCQVPDLDFGPQHFGSAEFNSMFSARGRMVTDCAACDYAGLKWLKKIPISFWLHCMQ